MHRRQFENPDDEVSLVLLVLLLSIYDETRESQSECSARGHGSFERGNR